METYIRINDGEQFRVNKIEFEFVDNDCGKTIVKEDNHSLFSKLCVKSEDPVVEETKEVKKPKPRGVERR